MAVRLCVHFPDRPLQQLPLRGGVTYVLGRGPDCDLDLDHPGVSRRHALLRASRSGWTLADLGSKNGTLVDGRPAAPDEHGGSTVPAGAWISLGGLPLRFETVSAEQLAREAEQQRHRWQTSVSLQARLDPREELESLLRKFLDSILQVAGADRGFVLLARPGGELELAAASGLDQEELGSPGFAGSRGAVEQTLREGRPVTLADASRDALLGDRPSVLEGGIRVLVCLPLRAADRLIGVAYADSQRPGAAFGELDLEILGALAGHAALAIAVARLRREVEGVSRRLQSNPESLELTRAWELCLPSAEGGAWPSAGGAGGAVS